LEKPETVAVDLFDTRVVLLDRTNWRYPPEFLCQEGPCYEHAGDTRCTSISTYQAVSNFEHRRLYQEDW